MMSVNSKLVIQSARILSRGVIYGMRASVVTVMTSWCLKASRHRSKDGMKKIISMMFLCCFFYWSSMKVDVTSNLSSKALPLSNILVIYSWINIKEKKWLAPFYTPFRQSGKQPGFDSTYVVSFSFRSFVIMGCPSIFKVKTDTHYHIISLLKFMSGRDVFNLFFRVQTYVSTADVIL